LPFSVSHRQAGITAFEHSAGGGSTDGSGVSLADRRKLPPLSIPEGGTSLEEIEHRMVELALARTGDNQSQAAKLLDISRDALRYKMKKFGLFGEEVGTG